MRASTIRNLSKQKLQAAMLLQLFTCLSWLTLATASAVRTIPTYCQSTCGNNNVPYPFGIGVGCYHNKKLALRCDTSVTPPRLQIGNVPIRNISLVSGTMTIAIWVSYDCYNKNGRRIGRHNENVTLSDHFTISDRRNKFTAVGCDTGAFMSDKDPREPTNIFQSGCVSLCSTIDYVSNGSCSGIGCCQTAIPKGLKSLFYFLNSYSNHSGSWEFNPCSYAFLADTDVFNFSSSDLKEFTGGLGQDFLNDYVNEKRFPAVVDWVIGLETCEKAKENFTSYACGAYSDCINSENGPGYTCNCTKGYEGNPYFAEGCTDIDECKTLEIPCPKNSICDNNEGGYNCRCKKGYTERDDKEGRKTCVAHVLTLQLGLGFGFGLLILCAVLFWIFWDRRERNRKAKFFLQNGGVMLKKQIASHGGTMESSRIFTGKELKQVSNNFREVIGEGGFGKVYKGKLTGEKMVAIKKSKVFDTSQVEKFLDEFLILSQVTHPNVVKLYGCCLETEVPSLVYEYVSNKNLFQHIHENNGGISISWENRLRIAAEIARALAYLHGASTMPIIHRNIKSSNILLDKNLTAKVADFGISKLVQLDQTLMSTVIQGTYGNLDPAYLRTIELTEKSDVYGFGVILVELLTGKESYCSKRSPEEKSLADYFKAYMKANRLFQLVEPQIIDEGRPKQIIAYSELAKRCLGLKPEERPTMEEVAKKLEKMRTFDMHPWIPQQKEESQSILVEHQDLSSIELSFCTDDASN